MVARSPTPQRYNSPCSGRLPTSPFLLPWSALPLCVMPWAASSCRSHRPDGCRPRLRFHSGTRNRSWSVSRRVCRPSSLPKSPSELESAWGDWVSRRNREIRARLERGDEDSVVNFLLFGTTFTSLPRALNDSARIGGGQRAAEVVRGRTADLIAGIASPDGKEPLQFVREVVARRGIDPTTELAESRRESISATFSHA